MPQTRENSLPHFGKNKCLFFGKSTCRLHGWKSKGFEVIHGSKALFGVELIYGSKGDGATYKARFFGKSQVVAVA